VKRTLLTSYWAARIDKTRCSPLEQWAACCQSRSLSNFGITSLVPEISGRWRTLLDDFGGQWGWVYIIVTLYRVHRTSLLKMIRTFHECSNVRALVGRLSSRFGGIRICYIMWKSHSECCRWYPQRWGRVFRARWMSRRYRKRLFNRLSKNRLNCRGDFCLVDWITFYVNVFSRFGCRLCCAKLDLSLSVSLLASHQCTHTMGICSPLHGDWQTHQRWVSLSCSNGEYCWSSLWSYLHWSFIRAMIREVIPLLLLLDQVCCFSFICCYVDVTRVKEQVFSKLKDS